MNNTKTETTTVPAIPIGTIIKNCTDDGRKIICWETNDRTGWYTKIFWSESLQKWYTTGSKQAILWKGLIVFLSSQILKNDDFIEITRVGKKCAFADVFGYDD